MSKKHTLFRRIERRKGAPHHVIKDPPFTRLDILTCRNMLIYMEPELQGKLMTLFNYSLNTGGIIFSKLLLST